MSIRIDPKSRQIHYRNRVLSVMPRMFDVLHILAKAGGEVVSRDKILTQLWGDEAPECATRAVDQYVARIRRILGRDVIRTATNHGYAISDSVELSNDPRRMGAVQKINQDGTLTVAVTPDTLPKVKLGGAVLVL